MGSCPSRGLVPRAFPSQFTKEKPWRGEYVSWKQNSDVPKRLVVSNQTELQLN